MRRARGGLWGNHGYEAAYPMTFADEDGDQLDGRNRYTLTFGQQPPVGAFWPSPGCVCLCTLTVT
jgi:hypothetical protein